MYLQFCFHATRTYIFGVIILTIFDTKWQNITEKLHKRFNWNLGDTKKVGKSIGISQGLLIILPNALGSKEANYSSFFQKLFEDPFAALRYLLTLFWFM